MPEFLNLALPCLVSAAILYLVIGRISARLQPPFVAMELASTPKHAANVLTDWRQDNVVDRATAIVILDGILVLLWLIGTELLFLAMWSETPAAAIRWTHGAVALGVLLAAFANWTSDAVMLTMLVKKKTYGWFVFVTRTFGWWRYATLALMLVYLIFRGEVYLYEYLRGIVKPGHWKTIGWMTAAMVLLAFVVMRRLAMFSQQYPTLLSLQLARDRLTAKSILERWGKRGRRVAGATLALQTALALLYGATLATISRQIGIDATGFLQSLPGAVAWLAIVAAACHVAQNLGAGIAVYFGQMGWWNGLMRRIGKIRILLLGLVGLYFFARLEWWLLSNAGKWLAARTPKIPPWL